MRAFESLFRPRDGDRRIGYTEPMFRPLRSVSSLIAIGGVSLLLSSACGGAATPTAASGADVKLAPAPDLGVALHVSGEGDGQPYAGKVKAELTSAMTSAGYKLITEDKKADVKGDVKVTATEKPSMFAVMVNGKKKITYKVTVAASFVGGADGAVVDTATVDFESDDGNIPAGAIKPLLGQLSQSGKLVAYQEGAKAKIASAEEDLWKAANADGCKAATKKDQCDGVNAYVKSYPSGKHTADARSALQASDASIAKAAEEETWKAAALDQCQKPTKSYDCKAVEDYVAKYPGGGHAKEGRDALKATEKAREGLKKKEDAAKKKASVAECEKECRRAYERAVYFEILSNRCIQTECK